MTSAGTSNVSTVKCTLFVQIKNRVCTAKCYDVVSAVVVDFCNALNRNAFAAQLKIVEARLATQINAIYTEQYTTNNAKWVPFHLKNQCTIYRRAGDVRATPIPQIISGVPPNHCLPSVHYFAAFVDPTTVCSAAMLPALPAGYEWMQQPTNRLTPPAVRDQ
jgi:hypothetical protein